MSDTPDTFTPDTFARAFQEVQKLAADFDANKAHYLSPGYQEQEARQDFIDKFWTALGWDVTHDLQKNPYAQEVKVERGVTMSEGRKRADYAFYLDPDFKNPRFFVEAKKPSVEIANKDTYFQALRYGWNGGTPLAVLTDFEQFHVLDSRARPDIDTALSRAVQKYHYTEYADPDKFGAIYWLFSREAVAAGALETYVAERMPRAPGKFLQRGLFHGGHQGMDESFLRELDDYRGTLARAFHAANPGLDSETLTEATQRVLDRLVFMRFLEDKLIEPEPMVAHFGDKGAAWAGFLTTSRRLDTVYNGNIFKPHLIDRLGPPAPNNGGVGRPPSGSPIIGGGGGWDDFERVFGQVCSDLSSEQSPYLFSLIPIHILGSIYERFLGKVIVVDGAAAKVEEKPEVRKAGGVYYTPDYIVRYIVDHTVGTQIAGKTPDEIAGLRFADIACGSGSFLLGVYDALLRHHTAYYNAKAKGRTQDAQRAGCEKRDGVWHLSLWQKRQILLDNVWGVDIDAQAVEVAQMSLYLKLLEEETTATARDQNLLHGAILPTLNKNIVFGNSLIGTDILEGQLFEPVEERKLNPLDFKQAFPQIMKAGGFDAIVGNPPYGSVLDKRQLEYLDATYRAIEGRSDLYELFIERAIAHCKKTGFLGYIVPSPLLTNLYTRKLRDHILSNYTIKEITNFGMDVFSEPTVHTCIVVLQNQKSGGNSIRIRKQVHSPEELSNNYDYEVPQEAIGQNANSSFDIFADPVNSALLKKLSQDSLPLSEICFIRQCIKTGDDKTYVVASENSPGGEWKPSLRGRSIGRYVTTETNLWIKYGEWLARNWKNTTFYETPKIAIRETGSRITATLDLQNRYFLSSLYAIYPNNQETQLSLKYLLSLINSTLASYFVNIVALELTKGAFTKLRTNQLGRLPIRRIDFSDPADKAQHDKMVKFVEMMLAAQKERANALTDRDMDYWQRRCDALDRQIDELVYELYGLTEDEITLVEGANAA